MGRNGVCRICGKKPNQRAGPVISEEWVQTRVKPEECHFLKPKSSREMSSASRSLWVHLWVQLV